MSEPWEEGFDTWTPQPAAGGPDEPPVDVDRDELLRLARELAARRQADQHDARAELEQLKESLRERAAAVAERERELLDLQRQLEKKGKPATKQPGHDVEALAARERQALERLQAAETRERELGARAAALETEAAQLAALREELAGSETDRQLVAAERERLEERLERARQAEKELAATRLELERQRAEVEARERAVALQSSPPEDREAELRALEERLAVRERELALLRQGLDAQRIVLRERERAVRRRDAAEARQSFGPPLRPPSFSDGLASFVRSRGSARS